MKLINLYNIYINRIVAAFLILFPFILGPTSIQMPKSKGYSIVFYNGSIDLFEFKKFLALVLISMIMLFMLAIKGILIKHPIFISIPLLIFVILVSLSTIFSINPSLSVIGLGTKWQGLITYLCYFIVFTFIYNTFRKKDIEKYIIYLLIPASIIALLSLFSFYEMDFIHDFIAGMKISYNADLVKAPIGNRISLGAYFSLFFPISFFALIYFKKHTPIYIVSTLLCFSGLMVSQSRTAWIGVFLGIVILLAKEFEGGLKNWKVLLATFITFSLLIVLIDISGEHKLSDRISNLKAQIVAIENGKDSTTFGSMRGFAYMRALKATKDHPFLGVGPDCYMYYGIITPEDYAKYPEWENTTIVTKAHSEYLEIISTIGIPAFLFYSFFLLQIVILIFKKPKKCNPLWLALFAGFFAYIIQAAANIGVIAVLPSFFSIAAILSRYYANPRKSSLLKFRFITIPPYNKRGVKELL